MKRPGTTEEEAQQIKVRVAQIASLQKDLALVLSAERLRIEAPVPGKPYVGIEVPNTHSFLKIFLVTISRRTSPVLNLW